MPKRTISFDEWHDKQVALNPRFEQATDQFLKFKGSRTKLELLLDEDLGADLGTFLKAMADFRVRTGRAGMDDRSLWRRATQAGYALVTAALDFWIGTITSFHLRSARVSSSSGEGPASTRRMPSCAFGWRSTFDQFGEPSVLMRCASWKFRASRHECGSLSGNGRSFMR